MEKNQIIDFINKNKTCFLATSIDNRPFVRGMMVYKADQEGIIFHTGEPKDLYRQVQSNPFVELCFFEPESKVQVRIKGKAVMLEDLELKKEILNARPYLKTWVDEFRCDLLKVFIVTDCQACVWTFETNFSPKEYINISK